MNRSFIAGFEKQAYDARMLRNLVSGPLVEEALRLSPEAALNAINDIKYAREFAPDLLANIRAFAELGAPNPNRDANVAMNFAAAASIASDPLKKQSILDRLAYYLNKKNLDAQKLIERLMA